MLFNSLHFAWFFPLVFFLYWIIPAAKWKLRNYLLLFASYYFYGSWDWRFLFLIFATSSADFLLGIWMEKAKEEKKRKWILFVSVFYNIGLLGFFKYFNFFADSLDVMLGQIGVEASFTTLNIVLPVGISFYTFQSLSYTIDVYRQQVPASKDYFSFLTFVAFFPQLVAGPIERASHLLPQFNRPRIFNYGKAVEGLRLILWGLFKKIAVADRLAYFVEIVFDDPDGATAPMVIAGAIFFSVQVYCDFSGYSDIARGTAKLLGFELMINFRMPFFSSSLREFWSRWHISLSTWFRDYLFHPLGGSRTSTFKWSLNILLTFLVSGLWHGASINFLIWGLLHGMAYLFESFGRWLALFRFPKLISSLFVFAWFTFVIILFRAKTIGDSKELIFNLGDFSLGIFPGFSDHRLFVFALLSILFVLLVDAAILSEKMNQIFFRLPRIARWFLYYILILLLLLLGEFGRPHSFVYFQF